LDSVSDSFSKISKYGNGGNFYENFVYRIENLIQKRSKDTIENLINPENTGSRKLAEKFGGILQDGRTERGFEIYHIPLR
jgi:hypothetical protein